ncbi:MAG: hypothetical protein IPL12_23000 [Bacteroidetes bacterium]|nr:hypothetical protein [Bacteroidota bacterium]
MCALLSPGIDPIRDFVGVNNPTDMEPAIGDATGLMRQAFKLKLGVSG